MACGLIKASFVPNEAFQQLRSLLRARKQLLGEQTRHIQRLQKTLEEANIKLDSVISDIMGVSGRRMIEAMIAGVRNPAKLAALADGRLKAKPKDLYDALHGRLTDHHRFLLRLHLDQYDALDVAIVKIDREVETHIDGMDKEVKRTARPFSLLECAFGETIPGVAASSATMILAEIGRDMNRFPTAGHLLAWAGLCPGQNESAGKTQALAPGAKATVGSRQPWSNAPGARNAKRTATTALSSPVCALNTARGKLSAPSPRPC